MKFYYSLSPNLTGFLHPMKSSLLADLSLGRSVSYSRRWSLRSCLYGSWRNWSSEINWGGALASWRRHWQGFANCSRGVIFGVTNGPGATGTTASGLAIVFALGTYTGSGWVGFLFVTFEVIMIGVRLPYYISESPLDPTIPIQSRFPLVRGQTFHRVVSACASAYHSSCWWRNHIAYTQIFSGDDVYHTLSHVSPRNLHLWWADYTQDNDDPPFYYSGLSVYHFLQNLQIRQWISLLSTLSKKKKIKAKPISCILQQNHHAKQVYVYCALVCFHLQRLQTLKH